MELRNIKFHSKSTKIKQQNKINNNSLSSDIEATILEQVWLKKDIWIPKIQITDKYINFNLGGIR